MQVTGRQPVDPADRRRQRRDQRVVVGLVEVDQRDEVLLGRLRAGAAARGACPDGQRRPLQYSSRSPMFTVNASGSYGASCHPSRIRIHLKPTSSRLAIEDGHGAEVSVRPDAELPGFWFADHADGRIVIDVHRPRGTVRQHQPTGWRAGRGRGRTGPADRRTGWRTAAVYCATSVCSWGTSDGPDVGREPDSVDVGVAGCSSRPPGCSSP